MSWIQVNRAGYCNCRECQGDRAADRAEAALQADISRLIDNPTEDLALRVSEGMDMIQGDELISLVELIYSTVQARIAHGFAPHQRNLQAACIRFANLYHDSARAEAESNAKRPWLGGA